MRQGLKGTAASLARAGQVQRIMGEYSRKGEDVEMFVEKEREYKYKLNLQYFAEDAAADGGGTSETAPESGGETQNPEPQNPLRMGDPFQLVSEIEQPGKNDEPEQKDDPAPEPEPEPVEEIDFGGRKVKVTDPVIKELHKDWSELAGTLTKESQRSKQLEAELQVLKMQMENLQKQENPQPEPQNNEPDPERLKEINEKYQEMAYEDPVGALIWLQQQPEYQQLTRPLYEQNVQSVMSKTQQQQEQLKAQIKQNGEVLAAKHADFRDLLPQMDQVINQYPHLRQQMESNPTLEAMETIYFMAKGLYGGQMAREQAKEPVNQPAAPVKEPENVSEPQKDDKPTPSVDDLINDPEFMKKVLGNEQVKQTIIKNYLAEVSKNSQTPVAIGSQAGGQVPAMPEQKPTSIKEAGKMFRNFMRSRSQ